MPQSQIYHSLPMSKDSASQAFQPGKVGMTEINLQVCHPYEAYKQWLQEHEKADGRWLYNWRRCATYVYSAHSTVTRLRSRASPSLSVTVDRESVAVKIEADHW